MGGIAGAAIQGAGDQAAAKYAQTGFNYATNSPLSSTYGPNGVTANGVLSQLMGLTAPGTGGINGPQSYANAPATQGVRDIGMSAIGPTNTAGPNTGGGVIGLPGVGGGAAAHNEASALNTGLTNAAYFPNYLTAQQNLSNAGTNAYSAITNSTNPSAASNAMLASNNAYGQAIGQAVGGFPNYFGGTATYAPNQVSSMGAIAGMSGSDVAGQQPGAGGGFF